MDFLYSFVNRWQIKSNNTLIIEDMRKVFLLAFALFAWNILANAQESDERYIEVTGSSEIEVVPDEIHFLIQIKEYWEEEYTGKSK